MKFFNSYLRAPIATYITICIPVLLFAIVGFLTHDFSGAYFVQWLFIGALFLLVSFGANLFFGVPGDVLGVGPGALPFEVSLAPLGVAFVVAVCIFFSRGSRLENSILKQGSKGEICKIKRTIWRICAVAALQGGVFAGLVWLSALLFAYFGADFMRKFGITVNFSSAVILAFILWFVAFAARMLFSVTVGSGIRGKISYSQFPCVRLAILRLCAFGGFVLCASCVVIATMLFVNFIPSLEPAFMFFNNTGAMLLYILLQVFFIPNIVLYTSSVLLEIAGIQLGHFDRLLSIFYFIPGQNGQLEGRDFFHYFWILFLIFAFILGCLLVPKITASTFVRPGEPVRYFFKCISISLISAVGCAIIWAVLIVFASGRLGFAPTNGTAGTGMADFNFGLSFLVVFLYLFLPGVVAAAWLFVRIWVYKKIMYTYF